jgi:hypothetical protein
MTKNRQDGNNVVTPLTYKKPNLAAIGIFSVILITILIRFMDDVRTLSIVGHICGFLCFITLAIVVGVILPAYLQKKPHNPLAKIKQFLSKLAKFKGFGWVKEDRSIQFLLLWIGVTLGLWGSIFGLVATL